MATRKPIDGSRASSETMGSPTRPIAFVFTALLALRLANALSIQTFFQPDEYFQSLEPAWQMAFGPESGAWITWEWREHLRSAIHPMLFAAVYRAAAQLSSLLQASPDTRSRLLLAAPKLLQAFTAATGDLFTWLLASKLYGPQHTASYATLALTAFSPWQWYTATRTFSNSLETALTIVALYYWPWQWFLEQLESNAAPKVTVPRNNADLDTKDMVDQFKSFLETGESANANGPMLSNEKRRASGSKASAPDGLYLSLSLAAVACILRPTNVIIWATISICLLQRYGDLQKTLTLSQSSLTCGSAIMAVSFGMDRAFYGEWTFPPLNFLYFNVVNALSSFYGTNRLDYYFTEGLPLLCTTALPFAVLGLWQALRPGMDRQAFKGYEERQSRFVMAIAVLVTVLAFTMTAHKEVRFIYPLLPMLHILAAKPLAAFFDPFPLSASKLKLGLLMLMLTINVYIAAYVSLVHQRGVIDVMHYLRRQQQDGLDYAGLHRTGNSNVTVGFLMPCHSTPWRSHLVHSSIKAWALTCEPPLDLAMEERQRYEDEADVFYNHPGSWIDDNMKDRSTIMKRKAAGTSMRQEDEKRKEWPHYLVFFEHLEPVMNAVLEGTSYVESARCFNTHWHDDNRRRGDVVVWCRED